MLILAPFFVLIVVVVELPYRSNTSKTHALASGFFVVSFSIAILVFTVLFRLILFLLLIFIMLVLILRHLNTIPAQPADEAADARPGVLLVTVSCVGAGGLSDGLLGGQAYGLAHGADALV